MRAGTGSLTDLARALALTARERAAQALARRRERRYTFDGRVVLLMGGSHGLGLAMAHRLARENARLVLVGREPAALDAAREQLEKRGADVLTITREISEEEDAQDLVARVVDWFGGIDVLVNDTGRLDAGSIDSSSTTTFSRALERHFFAPLALLRAVLPPIRSRGGGRIVNVGSLAAFVSLPRLLPYAAGKSALVGVSRGMQAELARERIFVTTVYPGLVRSPEARRLWQRRRAGDVWRAVADALPLLSVRPDRAAEEIVEACRRGDSQLVLSWPAKLVALLSATTPGLVSALIASMYETTWQLEAPPAPERSAAAETDASSEAYIGPEVMGPETEVGPAASEAGVTAEPGTPLEASAPAEE